MSRIAVIIILAITAALAVTAAVVLRNPPASTDASGPLLNLLPETIVAVTMTDSGGKGNRKLTRTAPGEWLFTVQNSAGAAYTHPADTDRVLAALQSLTRATHAGPAEAPQSATTLLIETEKGPPITIRVGVSALAGRVAVEIADQTGKRSLLAPVGPITFLAADPHVFTARRAIAWPGEPVAISMTRGTETLELERSGRTWKVVKPFASAADRAAVGLLQAALTNLTIASLAPASDHLGKAPAAIIRITTTTTGEPVTRTVALYGKTGEIEAALTTEHGEASAVLAATDLTPIFRDNATFLAKESIDRPAADVMAVSIYKSSEALAAMKSFRRAELSWTTTVDAAAAPIPATDARSLSDLVTLVCEKAAAVVQVSPPADFDEIAMVKITGTAEAPLGTLAIGLSTPPAAAAGGRTRKVLTVMNGTVARLYAVEEGDPMLAWLKANLP